MCVFVHLANKSSNWVYLEIYKLHNILKTVLRATYTIWLAKNDKMFRSWELVGRSDLPTSHAAGEGGVSGLCQDQARQYQNITFDRLIDWTDRED